MLRPVLGDVRLCRGRYRTRPIRSLEHWCTSHPTRTLVHPTSNKSTSAQLKFPEPTANCNKTDLTQPCSFIAGQLYQSADKETVYFDEIWRKTVLDPSF